LRLFEQLYELLVGWEVHLESCLWLRGYYSRDEWNFKRRIGFLEGDRLNGSRPYLPWGEERNYKPLYLPI